LFRSLVFFVQYANAAFGRRQLVTRRTNGAVLATDRARARAGLITNGANLTGRAAKAGHAVRNLAILFRALVIYEIKAGFAHQAISRSKVARQAVSLTGSLAKLLAVISRVIVHRVHYARRADGLTGRASFAGLYAGEALSIYDGIARMAFFAGKRLFAVGAFSVAMNASVSLFVGVVAAGALQCTVSVDSVYGLVKRVLCYFAVNVFVDDNSQLKVRGGL